MTPSKLKAEILARRPMSEFFSRGTMRFFGDTMKNYGVRSYDDNTWELYRKRPVKHGLQDSAYFDKRTFTIVFLKNT